LSVVSSKSDQKISHECDILLEAKKILTDYYSNYTQDSNASKLDAFLSEIGDDMNNPFFMMKNTQKSSIETLDTMYIIKKSQLLKLN